MKNLLFFFRRIVRAFRDILKIFLERFLSIPVYPFYIYIKLKGKEEKKIVEEESLRVRFKKKKKNNFLEIVNRKIRYENFTLKSITIFFPSFFLAPDG